MSDTDTNKLATPWIVVIIQSVVIAAQSVYIYLKWRGSRGGPSHRPRTEWYDLSRSRHSRQTGYSPIEPPSAYRRGRV